MDRLLGLVPSQKVLGALRLFLVGAMQFQHHAIVGLALGAPLLLAGVAQQAELQLLRDVGKRPFADILHNSLVLAIPGHQGPVRAPDQKDTAAQCHE